MTVILAIPYPGATQVFVYRPGSKEPHFTITGAEVTDLDHVKIREYMAARDWTDRGAKGWITPTLRCDEFMKQKENRGDGESCDEPAGA